MCTNANTRNGNKSMFASCLMCACMQITHEARTRETQLQVLLSALWRLGLARQARRDCAKGWFR